MRLPEAQSAEEIKSLVRHLLAGRVVDGFLIAREVPDLFGSIFLPVALGSLDGFSRKQLSRLAVFAIEGVDETCRWYIDGYPMFFTCKVWRLTDWRKALLLYEKAKEALDHTLG